MPPEDKFHLLLWTFRRFLWLTSPMETNLQWQVFFFSYKLYGITWWAERWGETSLLKNKTIYQINCRSGVHEGWDWPAVWWMWSWASILSWQSDLQIYELEFAAWEKWVKTPCLQRVWRLACAVDIIEPWKVVAQPTTVSTLENIIRVIHTKWKVTSQVSWNRGKILMIF